MISFTKNTKNEILDKKQDNATEKIMELYAILLSKNSFIKGGIELRTESSALAKYVYNMIKAVSGIELMVKYSTSNKMSGYKIYTISLPNQHFYKKFKQFFKRVKKRFDFNNDNHLKGLIRGVFLTSGYIKNPEKEYALDFFIDNENIALLLYEALAKRDMRVFITDKGNKYVVYLRNAENISDLLVMMNCMQVFFKYEEVAIYKEMKNKTIRSLNWEVANETKSLVASDKYIEIIHYIEENDSLSNLSQVLQEAAEARMAHPDMTLQDLAELLNMSKSGIKNRLRRIETYYKELVIERGEE